MSWRRVNYQKYWSDNALDKSAELRDALADPPPTHKMMAELAERYAALGEAEQQIKRQREEMRRELMRWVELNGPQTVEGVGTLILQNRTTYSYDVKALAEKEPDLFRELLELDCLEISRTKAKPHERLQGLRKWEIPGGGTALIIRKDR